MTLIWYKKYLNDFDFATNNSNVWFFKLQNIIWPRGLIVFQIVEQIIQESYHTFLMASLLG